MATPIENAFRTKLVSVFGHDRIYPNQIPCNPDEDALETECPAVAYRMLNEVGIECFTGTHGPYTATFLVETFGMTPEVSFAEREKLKEEFDGPVVEGNPGMWVKWIDGGRVIRWAVFSEPSSGDDFPMTDAHHVAEFTRGIVAVTYE